MIYDSTDYAKWTPVWTNANAINAGAYANGRFVLVDDLGNALVSTDGTNWVTNLVSAGCRLTELIVAGNYFVTAGCGGVIFTSTNGVVWNQHQLPGEAQIYGLAYGQDTVIATAGTGAIFRSDPISVPARTIRSLVPGAGGNAEVTILGLPGITFSVQSSPDLHGWITAFVTNAFFGRLRVQQPMDQAHKFFRAVPLGP
jgi:hypothetical protein